MADDRAHFSRPAPLTDDPNHEPTRPLVRRPGGSPPRLTQAVELAALIAAPRTGSPWPATRPPAPWPAWDST
jgi:hypothetical protein